MTIPEVKSVHPILYEKVQILAPEVFIVEERKQFRRVGIFIYSPAREDVSFLQTDARAAKDKRGLIAEIQKLRDLCCFRDSPGQFQTSIQGSRGTAAVDTDGTVSFRFDLKPFAG